MNPIYLDKYANTLLKSHNKGKDNKLVINSERASIISEFTEEVNKDRTGKYKKLPSKFIAIKLSHLNIPDLYYFLKNCQTAKCGFSRAFWGGLKIKK